ALALVDMAMQGQHWLVPIDRLPNRRRAHVPERAAAMNGAKVLIKSRRLVERCAVRRWVEIENRPAHVFDLGEHRLHPAGQLLFRRLPVGMPWSRIRPAGRDHLVSTD